MISQLFLIHKDVTLDSGQVLKDSVIFADLISVRRVALFVHGCHEIMTHCVRRERVHHSFGLLAVAAKLCAFTHRSSPQSFCAVTAAAKNQT